MARHAARAASFFRSRTMLRLLRFALRKMCPMPGLRKGLLWRITSPSGGSTFTTSAPRSARICVAYGPITTVVRSSTRTPSSGPGMEKGVRPYLFRLDAGQLDELRPACDLALNEFPELARIHRRYVGADRAEFLAHFGLGYALHPCVVQRPHYVVRRAGGRNEPTTCAP